VLLGQNDLASEPLGGEVEADRQLSACAILGEMLLSKKNLTLPGVFRIRQRLERLSIPLQTTLLPHPQTRRP
jgi:hypothetical protein